jgi:hypothetical protein
VHRVKKVVFSGRFPSPSDTSLVGTRDNGGAARGILVCWAVLGVLAASNTGAADVWLDDLDVMRIPIITGEY